MNIQKLRDQLRQDEGMSLKVYKDTLGKLTVGIGHLIQVADRLFEGDTINQERCEALFEHDIDTAIFGCKSLLVGFDQFPEEIQEILVNMSFNMGAFNLSKFVKMISAIRSKDYTQAADEMIDSLWYKQVGDRAKRLSDRMRAI